MHHPRPPLNSALRLLALAASWATICVSAAAATIPGRAVVSPNRGAIAADVDGGRLTAALALPDGDALLAGGQFAAPEMVVALRPDGTPDPSFGSGGIVRVGTVKQKLDIVQLLQQPDGKLLVVATSAATGPFTLPELVVERLDANGAPDPSYGKAGTVTTDLQGGCACGSPAALTSSGELLLTGATGSYSPALAHNPNAPSHFVWVVQELTSSGAPDVAFGTNGVASVAAGDSGGVTVDSLDDGDIVTTGISMSSAGAGQSHLTRLTASGAADPSFAAGVPLTVAPNWGELLVQSDGSVLLLDQSGTTLTRYTSAGAPDPTFGSQGRATVPLLPLLNDKSPATPQLLPGPGQDVLVANWRQGLTALDQEAARAVLDVEPIAPSGQPDASLGRISLSVPFGGGASTFLSGGPATPGSSPPLGQDSFAGLLLARADGSYLTVGTVGVAQPTGEGDGYSTYDFAAAAFTPTFAPEPDFASSPPPLHVTVRVPSQRAGADAKAYAMGIVVDASAAGLCAVTVRSRGAVVARGVLPLFDAGASRGQVELTKAGRRLFATQPSPAVSVQATAHDLFATTATAATHASL